MNTQRGFSMVEMIITLVLMGIVGVMMIPYYQSGVTQSATPIFRLQANAELQETMENIIAYWNEQALTGSHNPPQNATTRTGTLTIADLQALKTEIQSNIANFTPAGFTVTTNITHPVQMYNYASPSLDALTDQNEAMIVTLSNPDTGSISYVFTTGSNFFGYLAN